MKMQRSKASRLASSQSAESEQSGDRPVPDLSILRKSIQTSITGFTQARDVFDTGTEELKQLLTTECDVIYECKVCRNLFRSLANFISHKRVYCRQKFNTSLHAHFIHNNFIKDDMLAILQNEKDYQHYLSNKDNPKPIAESEAAKKPLREKKLMSKDLTSIIERLAQSKEDVASNDENIACGLIHQRISNLQTILSSKEAVYQNVGPDKITSKDSIQNEVAELDHMISSTVAVLGPDGKIVTKVTPSSLPDPNLNPVIQISDEEDDPSADSAMNIMCKLCQMKFSTQKTLKFHMKHKHADNRLVYPCPDCADTFSNSWSVYRHLFKVHRKSAAHIRKLRDTIQNKAFRTSSNLETPKTPTPVVESLTDQQRLDQENQAWMDNFEGDEIPRCGGCGRRFERRAALSSHRQTCQLRIAAQNKINSNIQRRNPAKPSAKESDTAQTPPSLETPPRSKAPKVDLKSEKKIEIKIRRDYHKAAVTSPSKVVTESNEEDGIQIRSSEESLSGGGENGDCHHFNNIITDQTNSDDCDLSTIIPAMKDTDDVYVIVSTEVISSDALDGDDDAASTEDSVKIANVNIVQRNSTTIDDSELNLEDIKRICNVNEIESEPSDQNEEVDRSRIENNSDDQSSKLSISDADKIQDNCIRIPKKVKTSSKSDMMANFTKTVNNKIELENNKTLVSQIIKFSKTHKKLHCEKCDLNFSFAKSFRKHMSRHLDWKRFKCKDCGFKCFDKSQCITHYKCHHKIQSAVQKFNSLEDALKDAKPPVVDNAVKKTSPERISIIVELSDEETEESAPVTNTPLKPVNDSALNESAPSDIVLELSDDDTEINRIESSSLSGRKRRRPKKFLQEVVKKKIKLKEETDTSMKDISAVSPKQDKRSGNSVDPQKLFNKDRDLPPSISLVCKTAEKSESASAITQNATESDLRNIKKVDKPITTSMSYTVRRPVRNRVKPLNKDFEYDLSNLMKLEAEAYKESHTPAAVSQKQQLKRKQFLQKETLPADRPTESGGIKDRPITPKPPVPPAVSSKSCRGALQDASRLAALRGKAQMKDHQLVHAYRDPQPFIQSLQRRHTAARDCQKTTLMKSLSEPALTSSTRSMITKTPQTKTNTMKTVSRPSTASTTSEKSSSDRTPTKVGTLSSTVTRQTYPVSPPASIGKSPEKTQVYSKATKKPLWKIKSIELPRDVDDPNDCIKSSKISLRKISILRDDTVRPKSSKRNSKDDSNSENISSVNNSPTSDEKSHSSDSEDDSETIVSDDRDPPTDNDVALKHITENNSSNKTCKIVSNQSKGPNCSKRMKIKMANYLDKEKTLIRRSLLLPDLKFLSKQKSLTDNNDINMLSNPTSSDSDSASSLKLTVNTEDICDLGFNKTYESFSDKDLIEVEYHVDSILSDEQENV